MPSPNKRIHGHAAEKPTVDQFMDSRARMNRASAEFLKIDVNAALTFLHVARQTTDKIQRERSQRAARKAYETVLRLMKRVQLSREEEQVLKRKLEQLKNELEGLRDTF